MIALLWLIPTRAPITRIDAIIRYEGVLLIIIVLYLIPKMAVQSRLNLRIYRGPADKFYYILIFMCCLAFFANPALPSFSVEGTSGFGFWFSLIVGLIWFLMIRSFLQTPDDIQILMRALLLFSIVFLAFFIGLMIINNPSYEISLKDAGIYVTRFGNGIYRFVFLANYAFICLLGYLMPHLFGIRSRLFRQSLLFIGAVALLISGNRISFISVGLAFIVGLYLFGKKRRSFLIVVTLLVLVLCIPYLIDRGVVSADSHFIRPFSLFNRGIEQESEASRTIELRSEMWKLAWDNIKASPFGNGFPRLSQREIEDFRTNRSSFSRYEIIRHLILIGGSHNAYIATGFNLGIGAMVALILFIVSMVFLSLKQALIRNRQLAEKGISVLAVCILIESALHLLASGNLTDPSIFIIFGSAYSFSLIITRRNSSKVIQTASPSSE